MAATAAAQGAEALGASSAWVALLDEDGRSLELAHAAGHEPADAGALRARSRSTPSCRSPWPRAPPSPLWLESARGDLRRLPALRARSARRRRRRRCCRSRTRAWRSARSGSCSTTRTSSPPADRDYLLALTRLCGQALGRARRYQVEHDLAATLQHALLPESLPQADGLELAVRYLPAADGTAAGGDFYDAVELPGGRLGIAVGDIVGHGPDAAAAMGQLRSALRAYALEGRSPARVLQLLSRYADGVPGARGATLVYAILDPGARELRYTLRRPSAAAAGRGRRRHALPGGRARRPARPRARPRLRGRDRAGARARDAGALLRRGDRAPRRAAGRRHGAARGGGLGGRHARPRRALHARCWTRCSRTGGRAATTSRCWPRGRCRSWSRRCTCGSPRAPTSSRSCARRCGRGSPASGSTPGDAELVVLAAGELCANAVEHAYPAGQRRGGRGRARARARRRADARRPRPRPLAPAARRSGRPRARAEHRARADARRRRRRGRRRHDRQRALPARAAPRPRRRRRAAARRPSSWHAPATCRSRACAARSTASTPTEVGAELLRARARARRSSTSPARLPGQRGPARAVRARAPLRAARGRRAAAARRSGARWRSPSSRASPTSPTASTRRWNTCAAMIVDCAHYRDGRRQHEGKMDPAEAAAICRNDPGFVWLGHGRAVAGGARDACRTRSGCTTSPSRTRRASTCARRSRPTRAASRSSCCAPRATSTSAEEVEFGEVSIFVGPGFIITVRQGVASDLHGARLRLEQHPKLLEEGPVGGAVGDPRQDRRRLRAGRRGPRGRHRGGRAHRLLRLARADAAHLQAAPRGHRLLPRRAPAARPRGGDHPGRRARRSAPACASTSATSTTTSSSSTRRSSPSATC